MSFHSANDAPDNRAIYDEKWDAWFDQKVHGPASRWLRWLIQQNLRTIDPALVSTAIDVGCGQGTITAMLSEHFVDARVIGTDFSETGIAAAQRHYGSEKLTYLLDIDSVYLSAGPYDLVTCFEVLEHVMDWESLLRRICAASRRYVLLSFPTGRMRAFEVHVGHVRNFAHGQVERAMDSGGFRPVDLFYAGFPFYSPIYRELCNLMDAGRSDFASGTFGLWQKLVSSMLFGLFRYFSMRRIGDQFCGLFERTRASGGNQVQPSESERAI